MKFEHEVLLGLSMTLMIVYLTYSTVFLHKVNQQSALRVLIYLLYMANSGLCSL